MSYQQIIDEFGTEGTIHLGEDWGQGPWMFGGITTALMMHRLRRRPEIAGRSPRTLTVQFVAPIRADAFEIETEILRVGRTMAHGQARVVQGGKICSVVTVSFGQLREGDFPSFAAPPPPQLASFDALRPPPFRAAMPKFTQYVDYRFDPELLPYTGADQGRVGGWCKFTGPVREDAAMLMALSDAWPPAVFQMCTQPRLAASVDMSVQLMREFPADALTESVYRYEAKTIHAGGGFAEEISWVWNEAGEPLARMRQLVILP